MSFSILVPLTSREDFPAAVEAAIAQPVPGSERQQVFVRRGRDTLLDLESLLGPENTYASGTISGHVCDGPDSYKYEFISVGIAGNAPPAVKFND